MRAKVVNEAESFTRDGDPYKKLDIGRSRSAMLAAITENEIEIYFEAVRTRGERGSLLYAEKRDVEHPEVSEYYNRVIDKVHTLFDGNVFTNWDYAQINDWPSVDKLALIISRTLDDNPEYYYAYNFHSDLDAYEIFYSKVKISQLIAQAQNTNNLKFTLLRR